MWVAVTTNPGVDFCLIVNNLAAQLIGQFVCSVGVSDSALLVLKCLS